MWTKGQPTRHAECPTASAGFLVEVNGITVDARDSKAYKAAMNRWGTSGRWHSSRSDRDSAFWAGQGYGDGDI